MDRGIQWQRAPLPCQLAREVAKPGRAVLVRLCRAAPRDFLSHQLGHAAGTDCRAAVRTGPSTLVPTSSRYR
ncbi:Uncharacterised protein [Mycobacteroides abscessus subsp. abscessus]|nr:Uncharacterised protein [Mycobacteroides abscessus subsp. abscessus]